MSAGKRDRRITLQERITAPAAYSSQSVTWGTIARPWAQVIERGERENEEGGEVTVTLRDFVIPWRAGVTTQHRILYDGGEHDIESVEQVGRRKSLRIGTKKVV